MFELLRNHESPTIVPKFKCQNDEHVGESFWSERAILAFETRIWRRYDDWAGNKD